MKALQLTEIDQGPQYNEISMPERRTGHALVKLTASALNRRDVWIRRGQYPGIRYPIVLGSDGCGVVCETDTSQKHWQDKRVIIYPGYDWGDDERVQSSHYRILGLPDQGTFAEYISVPVSHLRDAPRHLTDAQAAACPLAALTAWRALKERGRMQAGDRVLVTGIGGGVAQFAAQFVHALGGQLAMTSSSTEKLGGFDSPLGAVCYLDDDWRAQLHASCPTGFDIIIDGAGGEGFGQLVRLLAPGGRLVFYGGTRGRWPAILPQHLFYKQAEILGSTMGSPRDFDQMLTCINETQLKPLIGRSFPLRDGADAFDYLESGEQFGKVVLVNSNE
ncbi:MAG: zinc-binding dehydrogenase [Myxococcota bacterium]|nr:zinc-binding dehydrogenase [Myxococcota bacterium]